MVLGVLTLMLAAVPSFGHIPRDDLLLRDTAMGVHNRTRQQAGVQPLQWSEALAANAAAYANVIAQTGVLRHDPTPGRRKSQGENLWKGSRGYFSYDVMLEQMTQEVKHFRPGHFPHVSKTGNWSDLAHYTQIVWPETKAVGCAVVSSSRDDVLVCRYSPPGNRDGVYLR